MIINSYEDYKAAVKLMNTNIKGFVDEPNSLTKCLIISGEPGIGKSRNAKDILKSSQRPFVETGAVSAVKLYQKMWECPDGVILLEDSDNILVSKGDAQTVLKAGADMYQYRDIEWSKSNFNSVKIPNTIHGNDNIAKYIERVAKNDKKLKPKFERGELFPRRFTFTGQLIILTNKTLKEITDKTDSALANRSIHIELIMSRKGAFDVVEHAAEIMTDVADKERLKKSIDFITCKSTRDYCEMFKMQPSLRSVSKVMDAIRLNQTLDESILDTHLEKPTFDEA